MVTFVQFMRPVQLSQGGNDYWSTTERSLEGVTCEDKGNHMLFSSSVMGKPRRIRVPLTNIAFVVEDGEKEPRK